MFCKKFNKNLGDFYILKLNFKFAVKIFFSQNNK